MLGVCVKMWLGVEVFEMSVDGIIIVRQSSTTIRGSTLSVRQRDLAYG